MPARSRLMSRQVTRRLPQSLLDARKYRAAGYTYAVATGLHDYRALYIFMNSRTPNLKPIAFTFEKS
jgi:hypothetical protein